ATACRKASRESTSTVPAVGGAPNATATSCATSTTVPLRRTHAVAKLTGAIARISFTRQNAHARAVAIEQFTATRPRPQAYLAPQRIANKGVATLARRQRPALRLAPAREFLENRPAFSRLSHGV